MRALFPHGLPKITEHTITDRERLCAELDKVREQGYAVNLGESEPGISALAVSVREQGGRAVAALAVSIPSLRMRPSDVPDLVAALRHTAADIGRELP